MEEFVQRHRFFRWLPFPLGGGDHHQQALLGDLLELIVTGIHQGDAQLSRQQIVA